MTDRKIGENEEIILALKRASASYSKINGNTSSVDGQDAIKKVKEWSNSASKNKMNILVSLNCT